MKLKKLTASILAAAIAVTAIPLSVSAEVEETTKLPLVTAELGEIHGTTEINYVGNGVYFYYTGNGIGGAVRISDDELKEWRKTGELKFTDLDTHSVFTDSTLVYDWYNDCTFDDGDYMTLYVKDGNGKEVSRIAVRYDETAKAIIKVKDLDKIFRESYYNTLITHNGTTLSVTSNDQNEKITVKAINADGTVLFTNTHDYYYDSYNIMINAQSDDVLYYIPQSIEDDSANTVLYAVDYNGEKREIVRMYNVYEYARSIGIAYMKKDSILVFSSLPTPGYGYTSFYINEENYKYEHWSVTNSNGREFVTPTSKENGPTVLWGFVDLNGYTLAAKYLDRKYECDINPETFEYALVDVKNNAILSNTYKDMERSHDDGKSYLVQQDDGRWGYIDSKGEELAFFDDAGSFHGDYALIISDGKAYVIDRELKIISEGTKAARVFSLSKDISCFENNGVVYLMNLSERTEEDDVPPVTDKPEVTSAFETAPSPETTPAPETAPESEPDKSNTFTDNSENKAANIQVIAGESAIPSNAIFTVTPDKASSTDTRYAYNLTFTVDGKEYQPNGTVTVKIPVPEALKDNADKLKVYHLVDGNYTDMNAKLDNEYLIFETDHFSTYVVTSENLESDKPVPTGAAVGILPVVVIAALVIAAKKKR